MALSCPRCISGRAGGASAYRGDGPRGPGVALSSEPHPAGVAIERCGSCRGAFVMHETLVAIENHARRVGHKVSLDAAARRAWDAPTVPITCPSCHGETTRREWGIATLVFVDVCIECRGVWLDGGELETLAG